MNDGNVKFRVSILNPPDDLSPLKLRGWLRQQATEIQSMSGNGFTIIKLYLANKLRMAFTQKKLDTLLGGIVEKHANIYRIELAVVDAQLDVDQIAVAQEEAKEDIAAMVKSADDFLSKRSGNGTLH
jgi:hypothetical protein